jgi:hypothetical protein
MIEKSCAPSTDLRDFLFEKMSEMFPSPVTSHMLDVMRLLISRMFRGSRSAFPPELNDSRGFGLQKNTGIEGITKEGYAVAGLHSKAASKVSPKERYAVPGLHSNPAVEGIAIAKIRIGSCDGDLREPQICFREVTT